MGGLMRFLPLCCAVLLVLPAIATSQSTQPSPGWYRNSGAGGRSSIIYEDSNVRIVWENSYIYQHPGTDNLYWYAQVTLRNIGSQTWDFRCFGVGCPSCIKEHITRGGTYLGYVPGEETFCTRNPNFTAPVKPGEAFDDWVTFHNVPWKGDAVSLEWGAYGASGWVDPWHSPFSAPSPSVCPHEIETLGYCRPTFQTSKMAGYIATGTQTHPINYKKVTATWKVPEVVRCADGETSQSSTWVGLADNLIASDLVQIGTASTCSVTVTGTQKLYFAVWQVYIKGQSKEGPQHVYPWDIPIFPGHEVKAEVTSYGFGEFGIDIWNLTLGGLHWQKVVSGDNAPGATAVAECLQEQPEGEGVPFLTNFDSVTITCTANNLPIGSAGDIIGKVMSIKMKTGDLNAFGKGGTFTVDWVSP